MGIAPHFFYEMTIHEINLAYKGYMNKLEMEGNVMLMAVRKRNEKKAKPISLTLEDNEQNGKSNASVKQSTLSAREETFKALGIK